MNCPECRFENPRSTDFCHKCGYNFPLASEANLQRITFDEKLEIIQRYLPQGITEKILNQKGRIEGERRQVTVMFCDMEGFTALVERLNPEGAYQIMDQVYEILIHDVHDFQGIVNEMTGDGIMALFGAPIALENAPQRALRSAISIHRDMARFSKQKEGTGPMMMRIGIHTGPVVVGTLGNDLRLEFKAVGNTVNLASRMEKLAKAGSTYVTEETFKQTKNFFRFETVGEKSIKGKKTPLLVYKVLSEKEDAYRPTLGPARVKNPVMVGRSQEIDKLELQVMKVIDGKGSVINIIGEAGIGKSRLVAELTHRDVLKHVTFLEGRAISIGRKLIYYPIIDLLKQWASIRENDGEAAALGKLETAVMNICPDEYYEILPFVATLMGMRLSGSYEERLGKIEGEGLEKLILKSVRELIIKATEHSPMVIVLEDLQWADTSSIELMESLFRLAATNRIVFINVFRSGYRETGDRIIEAIKKLPVHYVEIALLPLDESKSDALIANLLNISKSHHAIIGKITRRTGGNPFFIEEVLRSLIDQRAIILSNKNFQVTKKIGDVAIPNSVNDVLMARIDSLKSESRELIKIASVIGRNFFFRILSEVAQTDGLREELTYLMQTEFIRERHRMGEVEFFFKHALTQEVVYESILPLKRKRLHLTVANAIEKCFSRRLHEFYGMLAYHYSLAEDLENTEKFLIQSGEEALRSAASDEAFQYYEEALQLYLEKAGSDVEPDKMAMLERNIAIALYNRGQHDEAVRYFDRTLQYYGKYFPRNTLSSTIGFLSSIVHLITALFMPVLKFRRTPTQRDLLVFDLFYKKCKALAITNPSRFFMEFFLFHKTITAFDLQKLENGTGLFVSASPLFSFSGISFRLSRRLLDNVKHRISIEDVRTSTTFELCETMHNFLEGNWNDIGHFKEDLIKKSCDIGEIWEATQILYWHGLPSIYKGSFDVVESILDSLNNIYHVYQYDLAKTYEDELKSCLLLECRRLNEALMIIKEGISFEEKAGPGFWELYVFEARVNILMGDLEKAKIPIDHASALCSKIRPVPFQMAGYYRTVLEYNVMRLKELLRTGNKTNISEYKEKVIQSAKILHRNVNKVAQYRTESYKLTGNYYWLINKQKAAFRWWHKALKEGERLGARLPLAIVYFELGQLLIGSDSRHRTLDGINAEDYLEMARSMCEEIKMRPCIDELITINFG